MTGSVDSCFYVFQEGGSNRHPFSVERFPRLPIWLSAKRQIEAY